MKKIFYGFAMLLTLCFIGSSLGFSNRADAYAFENDNCSFSSNNSDYSLMANDTDPNIDRPYFSYDYQSYLFAVKYMWIAGYGGDRVAMSKYSGSNYSVYGNSNTYTRIVFPDWIASTSKTQCDPPEYYYKTYNTATRKYSYNYSSSEHEIEKTDGNGNTYTQVVYGFDCQREPRDTFRGAGGYTSLPTSYSEYGEFYEWDHNGANYAYIIATIGYNETAYNIKLRIPPLFYNSIDVTIDGIKFTVRTGPWKIYVKCDKENVPVGSFQFAFDVVDSNDPILSSIHYYE